MPIRPKETQLSINATIRLENDGDDVFLEITNDHQDQDADGFGGRPNSRVFRNGIRSVPAVVIELNSSDVPTMRVSLRLAHQFATHGQNGTYPRATSWGISTSESIGRSEHHSVCESPGGVSSSVAGNTAGTNVGTSEWLRTRLGDAGVFGDGEEQE